MNDLQLNKLEKQSATWQKVEAYVKAETEALDRANRAELPIEETNIIRGRIRSLLKMLNDLDPPELDTPHELPAYDS